MKCLLKIYRMCSHPDSVRRKGKYCNGSLWMIPCCNMNFLMFSLELFVYIFKRANCHISCAEDESLVYWNLRSCCLWSRLVTLDLCFTSFCGCSITCTWFVVIVLGVVFTSFGCSRGLFYKLRMFLQSENYLLEQKF